MINWDFSAPELSTLKDNDVSAISQSLAGKNIALLICGSIAAYRAPDIVRILRKHGATVQVYASRSALSFVSANSLEWSSGNKVISDLSADAEHLEGKFDFDLFMMAPATYNSINKMAQGIADDVIPLVMAVAAGLLERGKTKVAIAPCMNGVMHNSILVENMKKLANIGVQFITPLQEDGKNKLPEIADLVAATEDILKEKS